MKKIFKSLKFRILAGLGFFLMILFYLFGYFFLNTIRQSQIKSVNDSVATALKDLQHEYNVDLNNTSEFEDVKKEFDFDNLYVQVLQIKNNNIIVLATSNDLKGFNMEPEKLTLSKLSYADIYFYEIKNKNLTPNRLKVGAAYLNKNDKRFIIQCAMGYTKNNGYVKHIEKFLIFSLLLLLLLILIVVFFVISKSLDEIKKVVSEVENIKIDGGEILLPKTGVSKEIDELIVTFNKLINELQKSYKKVKDFGQNASHELKTPLTIIRGEIEVGLRKDRSNDEYKSILQSVVVEANLLQDTVEKILFLSSNSDSDIKKNFAEVYVDEILLDIINEKNNIALKKNIQIVLCELEPFSVYGNYTLLKIAIANILDNAIKYSNSNSRIEILLTLDGLLIKDFGMGIASEQINKIFDRFFRTDKTRNHAIGTGLGLSIVKTILDLHKFKIYVKSHENIGTEFFVKFEQ